MFENVMFEKAARKKLRIESHVGRITVEDLFDLSLQNLDKIAIAYQKKTEQQTVSFITDKKTPDSEDALAFAIVKRIIDIKIEERDKRLAEQQNRLRREQILNALDAKKSESLQNMSVEELQKELASLNEA